MRSPEGNFWVYVPSYAATREINTYTKKTLEWAPKQFVSNVHTIFYFLHYENVYMDDDKNDNLHTSTPCVNSSVYVLVMTSQSIVDNITMTRQLWRNHVKSDV